MEKKKKKDLKDITSREYLSLFSPLGGIVVLSFLIFRILLPETIKIKNQYENLGSKRQEEQKLREKLNKLNSYKKDTLADLIDKTGIVLPVNEGIGGLLISLKSLEGQSGVVIEDYSFSQKQQQSKELGQILNISINGTDEQIADFLKKLEGMDRLLLLEKISVDFQKDAKSSDIAIFAPYLPYLEKIGSMSDELPEISKREKDLIGRISALESGSSIKIEEKKDFPQRENPFSL